MVSGDDVGVGESVLIDRSDRTESVLFDKDDDPELEGVARCSNPGGGGQILRITFNSKVIEGGEMEPVQRL